MILGFLVLNNPEAEAQMSYAHALSLCHVIQRSLARNSVGSLPQGYCEKISNLGKTTCGVLSVLLINLWYYVYSTNKCFK